MSYCRYTPEHIEFLRENVTGQSYAELTKLFNERFGMDLPVSSVMSTAFRYGMKNGRDTRISKGWEPTQFKKGQTPWNKGKKGLSIGGRETQFKKGNRPWNYRPIGSERVNTDGYVEVKIADPNKWKGKHLIIWEKAHGPVPKGYAVIFADGNRLNVTLDNLLLITRGELGVMNKHGLISADAELTKVGVIIADLHLKIGERKRNSNGRKMVP